ncbi:hypothetical protein FORC49_0706 [Listeria monocytogenes]|nr:hypothetical protein FORC49_0706 [Listeria monocytogenes]
MENLRKTEREKAIEIGNALLKDGYSEKPRYPNCHFESRRMV